MRIGRRKALKDVWSFKPGYAVFRPYIEMVVRSLYSKITVEGVENFPDPSKASVLIVGNHCNTLMDPLLILQAWRHPVAFMARADVFKPGFAASFLNGCRILPVFRRRDCENSSEKNEMIFDNVVECLYHNVPVCLFPEGTHRTRRSLMRLRLGVFRIAKQAAEENPDRPVYVVPVGVDYYDYFNIQRPVKVNVGEPLLIKGNEDFSDLADELYSRMSKLITWFPDDANLAEAEKAFEEARKPKMGVPHWILAALLLPVFAASGLLSLPIILLSVYLIGKRKDKAWYNTMRFVSKLILLPFIVMAAAVLGLIYLPWYSAICLVLAVIYSHRVFYRILSFYKFLLDKK